MNYYIADLHLGHKAILRLDHRPFCDLQQMEETVVLLWNATVKKDDTVYILGDFCWYDVQGWVKVLKKLNGKKVLIKGNHDPKQFPPELRKEFLSIVDYLKIKDKNRTVILSHYPIVFYEHSNNPDTYMLCGHIHNTIENQKLEEFIANLKSDGAKVNNTDSYNNLGQVYNVGAMMPWMQYTPRTLDEIIRRKK